MKFSASAFRLLAIMVVVVVVVFLVAAPTAEAAITCTQVISDLRPCFSYLQSGSGKPPSACCAGASTLAEAAATSADRRAACECIKTASQALKPNPDLAADLPKNCGIDLPFAISATLDCTKY
ncbi:unnamed protein product [Rhodiola kirilowii]